MRNFLPFSLLVLMLLASAPELSAQPFRQANNVPVYDTSGEPKPFAWSGGMNNPHFSDIDLDLDGKKDMVFYDRGDKTFTTFRNTGDAGEIRYEFAPELISLFDSCDCIEWALLVDYNCDGLEDVFCGGPGRQNMKLYEQQIINGDSVVFVLKYSPINVLSSNVRPIYNTPTDIPGIVDADGDGDIDIISSQTGSNFFTLHTNLAMENYGRCDTLDFVIGTGCWGHFYEGSNDNTIVVADTQFCKRTGDEPGLGIRHVGSTLLVEDFDGNGLVDCMLGDVSYPTANVVFNNGEPSHAFMDSVIYSYPDYDSAIYQVLFPGLFYVDVNNDGVRDLLTAPNASSGGEDVDGTLLYLNNGTDNNIHLKFEGRGIFSGESIDAGRGALPTFFDYNADGLTDLLIGSLSTTLRSADTTILTFRLQLYENTGSLQNPAFTLVDDDYLDASSLFPPLQAASPTVADLDNDGDPDLYIGQTDGTVRFFENLASPGQPAYFLQISTGIKDDQNLTIDVGKLSAPALHDIDGDQDLDLFIGNEFGVIAYYENTGTVSSPQFTARQDTFGGIIVSDQYNSRFRGSAKPLFYDIDGDDTAELLVGGEIGVVYIFENPAEGLTSSIAPSSTLFGKDFGEYSAPAVAELDDSGEPFYVIGTARGGLQLWNNRPESTNPLSVFRPDPLPGLTLLPNPARESVRIEWAGEQRQPATIRLLNYVGQEIMVQSGQSSGTELSLQDLSAGMYIVLVESGGERHVGRLVKE